ncbi:MAG: efflux RND transporter periplasmic adaptor subunit [Nitrospirae bacterium]|nr:efflux RND transporter periplasmic adaptor subunit [Nitrospirota bacterium]
MALFFLLAACGRKQEQPITKPPVPVTAGVAAQKSVPLQIAAIGNAEASSTFAVKAQVGGTLTRVHFTEGQDVKKGDLLFTIDPRPYEAALRQADANYARDRAQSENARAEERRYTDLVKKGYVSQTQYEQVRTNALALEAVAQASKAQVDNAALELAYCTIRSPFAGRTGSLVVYEGNLIKANADTAMVTINQIQPINVSFAVPDKSLPEIKKYMAGGSLKVEALLSKDDTNPLQGKLTFIDNAVDSATATIRLKGSFANSDRRLWPGQFINVLLTLATQSNAIVIPNQAVQTGQMGAFVFVIREDATVEARPVVVSRTFGEESVIESGLKSGEKVVTDGQLRLTPGAKVEIKSEQQTADKKGQGSEVRGQEMHGREKGPKTEIPAAGKAK